MEQIESILDLMSAPAFCVADGTVTAVNEAARRRGIAQGTAVDTLLATGREEYSRYNGGSLYLTVLASGISCGASVSRMDSCDIFLLEQENDQAELQAMALAAQELRSPLTSVMAVADRLFPLTQEEQDPALQDQVARINRGLLQMMRIICNMSDAYRSSQDTSHMETRDIGTALEEIFLTAGPMIAHTGITLRFSGLNEPVYGLMDHGKLERAVHNILSNAVKFTPEGGTIDARLTRKDNMLHLTVEDSGTGIHKSIRGSIYERYRREPALEDSRHGIGLGMVLIRSAATAHGGTVLLEQPEGRGSRLTMTIAIRQSKTATVRSPMFEGDYAGGMDHRLLELSGCLPAQLYRKEPTE